MPNILDGLGLEGSALDGLAEWPASTTARSVGHHSWADPADHCRDGLDPAALQVEEAFIELVCQTRKALPREENTPRTGGAADRRRNGSSELTAVTAETWGCIRRNACDVVAAAHKVGSTAVMDPRDRPAGLAFPAGWTT